MRIVRSVLLVHDEPDGFCGLESILDDQRVCTFRAHGQTEARNVLRDMEPIDLILTAAVLPDGTWRDTIHTVRCTAKCAPVIVVSRIMNVPLYLDTQDAGAVDFIVPPVTARDLAFVLRVALNREQRWACRPEALVDPCRPREAVLG
jgi:DNA-binding response OmpR family regulator